MINKLIIAIFLYFLFVFEAQPAQTVQVFMKGKVIDEITGNPVSVNIEFRTPNGKKIKIQSNSINGAYEQIFNAGDSVEVVLTNWDIARKTETIYIDNYQKYTEIERNFYVTKFTTGGTIAAMNAFNQNDAEVLPVFGTKLEEINKMLLFNRNVKFEILISAKDTYKVEHKTVKEKVVDKTKKKKKDTKEQFIEKVIEIKNFNDDDLKNLVNKRVSNIKSFLQKHGKFLDRVVVKEDFSPGLISDKSGTNAQTEMNLRVIVSEIKNAMN
ncbi:MAG: hypothetical protein N2319_06590 [Candidatus Kapabacteria bacterium]|nr:hypothetical protein [Candidatus Kapabacteria bacterium]